MVDHYGVLGLERAAGEAEVRRAYKKAALQWHPDKNPRNRASAEAMFKQVAEAYRVLMDPRLRATYDQSLRAAAAGPPMGNPRAPSSPAPSPSASRAAPASDGMEEAYSLFEQVFGGRNPFDHFEDVFENPSSESFDRLFQDLAQISGKHPGAGPLKGPVVQNSAARTANADRGIASSARTSQIPPPAAQPVARLGAGPGPMRVRCLGRYGVAWRRSMRVHDRLQGVQGPSCGDIVAVQGCQGNWVQAAQGWLPLTIDGQQVLELLDASRTYRVQCLSREGVAYRRSMNLSDREQGVRGPDCGDVLAIEERRGNWVRTAGGWLPLAIGEAPVLALLDETVPAYAGPWHAAGGPVPAPEGAARWQSWWPSLRPGLSFPLLTVLGGGGYVALRAARLLFWAWWKASFGLLPYLWR